MPDSGGIGGEYKNIRAIDLLQHQHAVDVSATLRGNDESGSAWSTGGEGPEGKK